jgi:AcrR family transcriptional regulator
MPRLSQARRDLLNGLMKDTIFEATTSVLRQHGVDGTTMNRVAEAAGLAKSSLYDYFSSKNELLAFAVSRMFAPTVEAFAGIASMELPAVEKLRRISHMAFASVEKHRASLLLFLRDDLRNVTESSRLEHRPLVIEALSVVFAQGMADGQFRQEDIALVSRMFLGCLGEMCELWLASDPPEPVEQRVETLLRVFLGGMLASPAKDAFD